MAQKVNIILVDDVDGSEAVETVYFSLDNKSYEIDLSEENAAALREAIAPWIGHGRKASGSPRPRRAATSANRSADLKDIREWARANNMEVSERGRISAAVQEAYAAAH